MTSSLPAVGLFVTCIVDIMRPQIGFAAIKLLEQSGCTVDVPRSQTCCGQPAYNSGDTGTTKIIARQIINAFEGFDYVVCPSGSCTAMIKVHFPEIFENDAIWHTKATLLAGKTYELMSFLSDVQKFDARECVVCDDIKSKKMTYHDSCSGHNELGIYNQPRQLLESTGCNIIEMKDSTECCGFGGTFCVKYPDISNAMVSDKSSNISNTGAEILVGGDYSCLMNISGKLNREHPDIKTYHVAEILAGRIESDN